MKHGRIAAKGTAKPPFHADHVGSFLRPKALIEARDAKAAGRIDAAALRAVEDEAIRDVVAFQGGTLWA